MLTRLTGLTWVVLGVLLLAGAATARTNVVVDLKWDAPTKNSDGTPITELAGYVVKHQASGVTRSIDVKTASIRLTGITPGVTNTFAVCAYNAYGKFSEYTAPMTWAAPVPVPGTPGSVIVTGWATITVETSPVRP